ncbi:MAG: hypothetical protein KA604_04145 [Candidatus Saccharimonas sp.]|nr:hypothetical protein [Candidatus Saccharimonas sp.]
MGRLHQSRRATERLIVIGNERGISAFDIYNPEREFSRTDWRHVIVQFADGKRVGATLSIDDTSVLIAKFHPMFSDSHKMSQILRNAIAQNRKWPVRLRTDREQFEGLGIFKQLFQSHTSL